MKIVLPLPPNRSNARWHWRTEHRKKTAYFTRCLFMIGRYRPPKPFNKVRISATLYVWNRMDLDNLMARMKWPLDWLVRNGWLTDDGPDVIEWELPQQVVERKHRRIEIDIEPIGVVDGDTVGAAR